MSPISTPCSPKKSRGRSRPKRSIRPRTRFPTIIKIQEDPKPFFQDKDYYKKVLTGEGDEGTRLHDLLGKYMKAEDPEEKSKYRAQLISAFWELGSQDRLPGRPRPDHAEAAPAALRHPLPRVPLPRAAGHGVPDHLREHHRRAGVLRRRVAGAHLQGAGAALHDRRGEGRRARTPGRRSWTPWRRRRASGTARSPS